MRFSPAMIDAPAFPTVRTEIAGLSITDLAGRFGTPLYVYDRQSIDRFGSVSRLAGGRNDEV